MAEFVEVATTAGLKEGEGMVVEVGGKKIALFNVRGEFFAVDNTCLHRGGPIGEGSLDDAVVTCPWHGWQFDVKTGVSPVNPAARLPTYEVRVAGGKILIAKP